MTAKKKDDEPKKRGPKPKHSVPPEVWENMTAQERNAHASREWYQRNRDGVRDARRKRYAEDPKFRRGILKAAKRRRPIALAQKAPERFEKMVADKIARAQARESKAAAEGKPLPKKRPRFATVDGAAQWVYPTGELALRVGRVPSVIRLWLSSEVLPGSSLVFGGKAFFTVKFIESVYEACKRVYFLDGNGSRGVLCRLIREELTKRGVSWVPHGGSEAGRVHPKEGNHVQTRVPPEVPRK